MPQGRAIYTRSQWNQHTHDVRPVMLEFWFLLDSAETRLEAPEYIKLHDAIGANRVHSRQFQGVELFWRIRLHMFQQRM